MFTNLQHSVEYVRVTCLLGKSDHCVLSFDLNCYWDYVSNESRLSRNFSKANFSANKDFVNNTKLPLSPTTERSFSYLHRLQCTVDTDFIPRVRISRKNPLSPHCIRRLVITRNKLFAIMKTDPSHENSTTFHQIRNKCRKRIGIFCEQQQRKLLENAQNNPPVLFKYLRGERNSSPNAHSLRGLPKENRVATHRLYRKLSNRISCPFSRQQMFPPLVFR